MGFRLVEKLGHGLDRQTGTDHHDQLRVGDHGNRIQRLGRVMAQIEDMRVDDHRTLVADQQGIAVRVGLGDDLGADIGCRTGAVFNDDAPTQSRFKARGKDAGDGIGPAACGIGHDKGDRLGRIILRHGRHRRQSQGCRSNAKQR